MTTRNPFDTAKPAGRGRRWWLLAGAGTVLVLVLALVFTIRAGPDAHPPCAPCVIRSGGQSVGVTDGSFLFSPALRTVERDIESADQHLTPGKYVTVAFLGPLTPSADVSISRIRSWLEGAYTAQLAANSAGSGAGPQIRLVLANTGSTERQYQPVVRQLDQLTTGPDPLVAVTGLGISVPPTQRAARQLSADGIPMVGAVITGDSLDSSAGIHGLFRVNPDVRDEVSALADYLRGAGLGNRAMLIQDTNGGDLYTESLNSDFRTQLGSYMQAGGFPEEPFDAAPGSASLKSQFYALSRNLCGRNPPNVIFYAGRVADLPDFIRQLWARGENCEPRHIITVVTGSDASSLQGQLKRGPGDAPVRVLYVALANPAELAARPNGQNNRKLYQAFVHAFTGKGFSPADLSDGWAIMAHDAVTAADQAIIEVSLAGGRVTRQAVRTELPDLSAANNSVPGAAGAFEFDPVTGNPTGRDFPVMELTPGGRLKVLNVYPLPRPAPGQ
jgi:ABC-type branched-subunit amino acid transport system substrate-binding protein